MVGEMSDHHKVRYCSTIALLQERFRQLEKVKEMREERSLMKLLPGFEKCGHQKRGNSYYNEEPSKLFFQSEIIHPTTQIKPSSSQLVHLSLWPNSPSEYAKNYFVTNITTTKKLPSLETKSWFSDEEKLPSLETKSWLTDALLSRSCLIKVDDTATTDVDTSLHL